MNICRFGSNTHEKKTKDLGSCRLSRYQDGVGSFLFYWGRGVTYEQVKGGRQVGAMEIETRDSSSPNETTAHERRWGTFTRTTVTT